MSLAVANQYAKAMLDVVMKPGSKLGPDAALLQMETFRDALAASPELREIMTTPAVGRESKRKALTRIAGMLGLDQTVVNFLSVVKDHRRVGLIGEICAMFRQQLDERRGVVRAHVRSAREMDAAQREALRAELRKSTGSEVELEYSIEPALVGGVTVTIGSTVYDGSVRGQLEGLRRRLTSEG